MEANRRNSLSSTGPRTPEGKAAVRFNARKSGIDAASQLIPGEDAAAFEAFAREFAQSCHPADAREQELVDQMIDDAWRLRRLRKAESQRWTRSIENRSTIRSYREETKIGDSLESIQGTLHRLQRIVSAIRRSYHQAAADLDRLQAARAKQLTRFPEPPMQMEDQSQFAETGDPVPPTEIAGTKPIPFPSEPSPVSRSLSTVPVSPGSETTDPPTCLPSETKPIPPSAASQHFRGEPEALRT